VVGRAVKIQVNDAVRAEVDEHQTVTNAPIECAAAKAIAAAVVELLEQAGMNELPRHLRQFVAYGDIALNSLRVELAEALNLLTLDPDDLPLINALIRYFQWCGDREGGPAWLV
jgi:tRNA G37 N-methylase Trm5